MASEYTPDYVSYIYAIFVLFGGLIGYVKARKLKLVFYIIFRFSHSTLYSETFGP